ncbi:MAG TPA: RNA methyltransferase substrate-binding domain-containing protein, partial [Pseudomonadales bacterium]|nr:RNA methyltransferase substrate-binding domain-containing protein [Pseudomonadales bacterium]
MSQTVYGVHAVTALLHSDPTRISRVLLQQGREEKLQALIKQLRAQGIAIEQRSRRELDQLAPGVHQGVVALVETSVEAGENELFALLDGLQRPAFLLVLDGITDPHNLGACLRTANAAGADGIVLPKDRSAPLNAVARKAASGAAELTPCFRVTNLARTL